jgi:hypothetical protein
MKKRTGPPAPFCPQLPVFLLAKSGRPLAWNHDGTKAVIGYSNGLLALAAGEVLQKRGLGPIRVLSVSTEERFREVVSQLARHGVHRMIWNHDGGSATHEVIHLS